jgi:HK97 family phage major capsid protein
MIERKLLELHSELKSHFGRSEKRFNDLQRQVDGLDVGNRDRVGSSLGFDLKDHLESNDSIKALLEHKRGTARFNLKGHEYKTTISSSAVGASTSGVLQIDRSPGIVPEARQMLRVRDVLAQRPTTLQLVDFVKVNSPLAIGSPQTEASDKGENAVTFTTHSEQIRTLATWIPASRQVLDDLPELAAFINGSLAYYVNLEEELQLLSGSGSGVNLNGLITQATAFNTGLLSNAAGWNKIDIIGRAIQQLASAKEVQPTFAVLNPADWSGMRLQKDSYGRYILGDPQQMVRPSLFGLDIVSTVNIASGTFLVGSGSSNCVEICDRMEMEVEISNEHSDYFTRNLVAIRAEKRLALLVKRPAAFVTGTFSTSP